MYEFIVLGLIPGTQIQITFFLWMLVVVILGSVALGWIGHRTHAFRDWLITLNLLMMTRSATSQRLRA
jgi:hypothetical protein